MEETKTELIERLLDEKAKENNQIDLNAYALGLEAMYEVINYTRCCTQLLCIDKWCYNDLTKDNKYKLITEDNEYYTIVNDLGEICQKDKELFELIKQ